MIKKAVTPEVLDTKDNLPILTDKDIAKAVKEINEMVAKDLVKTAVKVGDFILKTFFNNNIQLAMSKNPTKVASYRKLQNHKDLNIKFTHLNQMVRIAAQEQLFPEKLDATKLKLLTYSHRVELLQVDEADKKIELAKECIDGNMSVRTLHEKIKGKSSRVRSAGAVPFNPVLTNILDSYSEQDYSEEVLQNYSLAKIGRIKSNIDGFLSYVDEAMEKFHVIKERVDPIFDAKKGAEEQKKAKGTKKQGRRTKVK